MTLELPPEFHTDYRGAVFGGLNRMYRYLLWRRFRGKSEWRDDDWLVAFMLNPSLAGESKDDPTVRILSSIAVNNGYRGLAIANLCAFRAKDPKDLYTASHPVGPDNNNWTDAVLALPGERVLVGWGVLPSTTTQRRALKVLDLIRSSGKETVCLERTRTGYPKHPLYSKATASLIRYDGSHEDEHREREEQGRDGNRPARRGRSARPAVAAHGDGGDAGPEAGT